MKALIKELAKREGLKSEVKIGDLREAVSKLQDMLAEEIAKLILDNTTNSNAHEDSVFTHELCISLNKKINKILKKNKHTHTVDNVSFGLRVLPVEIKK